MAAGAGERHIYINGRFLDQPASGIQRVARETVAALDRLLAEAATGDEKWVLLTTGTAWDGPPLKRIVQRSLPSVLRGHAWEQATLARAARDGVLIGLAGSGPLTHRRQIVFIHDASVFRNPHFFAPAYGRFHRALGRALARRSSIATVSRFSRTELADVLAIDPASILLLPNGADHVRPNVRDQDVPRTASPYFLILGNLTRNKNVGVAVAALEHVPGARLVIVGSGAERVFGQSGVPAATDRVTFAGRVDDEGVADLMRDAEALIFPSLYEGFGLPPLEAMARGCPVIASDIPAVREVCGDAALLFDPHDPRALAARMREVMAEERDARTRRRERGIARAACFTWEASARDLVAFVRNELRDPGEHA